MAFRICNGHGCGGCEECQSRLIREHEDDREAKIKALTEAIEKMENQELARSFLPIDQHDMTPGKPVARPVPYKLKTVEPMYCAGGESITDRTWVDDYKNVVGKCDHCETLQACYADGERYKLNDHMSTPLGHRCSECDGPIWVEDNYMCALCIEAMR